MTQREALQKAIDQWHWVADETKRQKRKVNKFEYFDDFEESNIPEQYCYLCEYALQYTDSGCYRCGSPAWAAMANPNVFCTPCITAGSWFLAWNDAGNWQEAAEAADGLVTFLESELEGLK